MAHSEDYPSHVRIEFTVRRRKKHLMNVVIFAAQTLQLAVQKRMTVGELFHNVCNILHLNDDREYFGLAQLIDGCFCLLDEKQHLGKVLHSGDLRSISNNPDPPKDPDGTQISSSTSSLSVQQSTAIRGELHFCVQSFLPAGCEHDLEDPTAKYLYYLHLRRNHVSYAFDIALECLLQLCALALQVDYGDYDNSEKISASSKQLHQGRQLGPYFDPKDYVPLWVIEHLGTDYLRQHVPRLHADLHGMSESRATSKYIHICSSPSQAAAFHLFPFKDITYSSGVESSREHRSMEYHLGLCYEGVAIFQSTGNANSRLSQSSLLPWLEIGSLQISRRKMFLRLNSCNRRLLKFQSKSQQHVQAFFQLSHRLYEDYSIKELQRLTVMRNKRSDEEEVYRENYIYSTLDELQRARMMKKHEFHATSVFIAVEPGHISPSSTSDNAASDSFQDKEWSLEPVKVSREDVGHKHIRKEHVPVNVENGKVPLSYDETPSK